MRWWWCPPGGYMKRYHVTKIFLHTNIFFTHAHTAGCCPVALAFSYDREQIRSADSNNTNFSRAILLLLLLLTSIHADHTTRDVVVVNIGHFFVAIHTHTQTHTSARTHTQHGTVVLERSSTPYTQHTHTTAPFARLGSVCEMERACLHCTPSKASRHVLCDEIEITSEKLRFTPFTLSR